MKNRIMKASIGITVIAFICYVVIFIADVYTVPIVNDASLAQLNGGEAEYLEMRTTNKLVETVQHGTVAVSAMLMLIITLAAIYKKNKKEGVSEKENSDCDKVS